MVGGVRDKGAGRRGRVYRETPGRGRGALPGVGFLNGEQPPPPLTDLGEAQRRHPASKILP